MNNLSNFPERLSELMFDKQLSPDKLAVAINCNSRSIREWQSCNNKYFPSIENLIKLADYFQCSLEFLLGIEDENYLPNPKPTPPFAKRFRPAIEAKGFKIYSLYRATEISTGQMYKWINGQREPSLDSLLRIAAAIGCSLDYLVGRE